MRCVGKDSWRADSGAVNDAIGAVGKFVSDNLETATGAGTVIADLVIL